MAFPTPVDRLADILWANDMAAGVNLGLDACRLADDDELGAECRRELLDSVPAVPLLAKPPFDPSDWAMTSRR